MDTDDDFLELPELKRLDTLRNKKNPSVISENVKDYTPEELEAVRKSFIFDNPSKLKPAVRENIRGMSHILDEADKYIVFLKNYLKLKEANARTSPGLLLSGEPGLGKTLTARYIATESKARVVEVNEFPRQQAGWTPQDIMALFRLSKDYVQEKSQPIMLFWDEIEVVAKERRKLSLEEASTVSSLTTQLDGFAGKNTGVVLVVATNYEDYLDDALFRPGRLGHKIIYTPPSRKGKIDILKYYVKQKKHQEDIDYNSISFFFNTEDSPAKIEETVEEAYLNSCIKNLNDLSKAEISSDDLVNCLIENVLGNPRETYLDEDERMTSAIHEAGHAISGRLLKLPVQIVTVMPHGYNEGKTLSQFEEGDHIEFIKKQLVQGYGGVTAERMFNRSSGGEEKDLEQVTSIAFGLITRYGRGYELKGINLKALDNNENYETKKYLSLASNKLRRTVEKDMFKMLKSAKKQAEKILGGYGKERIDYVARAILDRKFVVQKDLDKIMQEADNL